MRRTPILLLILVGALSATAREGHGLYGDLLLERKGGSSEIPPAVFSHAIHRIRYRCAACHPAVFGLKRGSGAMSMKEIQEGRACGVCHNGKIAWGVNFETCPICHRDQTAGGG
jgi:c(7)-type cytochrome triheme protein